MSPDDDGDAIGPDQLAEAHDPDVGDGTPDTAPHHPIGQTLRDRIQRLWRREPARVIAALAGAVVFVAANVGVIVDQQDALDALALTLPLLLGGEAIRGRVEPT